MVRHCAVYRTWPEEGKKQSTAMNRPKEMVLLFSLERQHRTIRAMFKVPRGRHTAGYSKLDLKSGDAK
jgi:hypothetical protein